METLQQIWERLAKSGYETDKGSVHSYVSVYEKLFEQYRESNNPILEIGLFNGHSLRMWEQYFFHGNECYGIDSDEQPHAGMADLRPMIIENIHNIYILDAENKEEVEKTFHRFCEFDIILEDAAHSPMQQISIYNNFKKYLLKGGVYIIEDIQDIDATKELFENIDPEKEITILDRRHIKGRYDDVIVLIKDKS